MASELSNFWGMGVVFLPERAVEAEVAAGQLVPVLPDW